METKAHLVEKEAASNARLSWMQLWWEQSLYICLWCQSCCNGMQHCAKTLERIGCTLCGVSNCQKVVTTMRCDRYGYQHDENKIHVGWWRWPRHPKWRQQRQIYKCFASYARNLNYCQDVWFKLLSTNKSSFKPFKQTNIFQKQHRHQNMFDKVWYCLQWSIASKEKSVNAVELGSSVQLIREKSASTQLVPCITLAMPPQYSFR